MKRLPFRSEMARAWHQGIKTVTRRVVKWPEWVTDIEMAAYKLNGNPMLAYFVDGEARHTFGPTYQFGTTVIIAEPLYKHSGDFAYYAADDRPAILDVSWAEWKWKVSRLSGRYMPNWAARSWAKVISVRVERLQDITEEDAKLEGARFFDGRPINHHGWRMDESTVYATARAAFASYIDKVNGPGTWDANRFVFRYELEKLNAAPVEAL